MREVWSSGSFVAFGQGDVDLDGVMGAVDRQGFDGWIVVEQDVLNAPDADIAAFRAERGADQLVNREALRDLGLTPDARTRPRTSRPSGPTTPTGSKDDDVTTPLRFGLIGTGRIGQVHAANIAADPEAVLAWVCDPFVEGAEAVSARHGGTVTTDAAEMFASGDVDAVLIASPTPTHVDLHRGGARRRRPRALREADRPRHRAGRRAAAPGAVRRASRSRSASTAASTRRSPRRAPGWRPARSASSSSSRSSAATRRPLRPRTSAVSGGIFRDMTIHDFDMARFFLPDIVEVTGDRHDRLRPGRPRARRLRHRDRDAPRLLGRPRLDHQLAAQRRGLRPAARGVRRRRARCRCRTRSPASSACRPPPHVEAKPPYQDFFLERYAAAYVAELRAFIQLARGEDVGEPDLRRRPRRARPRRRRRPLGRVERVSVAVEL